MHGTNGVGSFNSRFLKSWELASKLKKTLLNVQSALCYNGIWGCRAPNKNQKKHHEGSPVLRRMAEMEVGFFCCKFSSLLQLSNNYQECTEISAAENYRPKICRPATSCLVIRFHSCAACFVTMLAPLLWKMHNFEVTAQCSASCARLSSLLHVCTALSAQNVALYVCAVCSVTHGPNALLMYHSQHITNKIRLYWAYQYSYCWITVKPKV